MSKHKKSLEAVLLVILILSLFSMARPENREPVTLSYDHQDFSLDGKLNLFIDESTLLNIKDIILNKKKYIFSPIKKNLIRIGMTEDAVWIKFRIKKKEGISVQSPWVLELSNPNIHYIDFFQVDPNGKIIKTSKTGLMTDLSKRDHIYNKFVFFINSRKDDLYTVYLRIKSESFIGLSLSIKNMTKFISESYREMIFSGIFLGLLIIMAGYNLFLFISIREKIYLYLSLSIGALFFFISTYSGIGIIYLWRDKLQLNYHLFPLSIIILLTTFTIFADSSISANKNFPKFHKVTIYLLAFSILPVIFAIFGTFSSSMQIIIPYSIIILIFLLVVLIKSWRKGLRVSGFLLLGYIPVFITGLYSLMKNLSIIADPNSLEIHWKIASTFFILMISLGLGEKIKILKQEKSSANSKLVSSQSRFKTIVENSHSGIINVDNNFKFKYVNPQFEKLLGYPAEYLLGKDFRNFLDEESLNLVSERYKKRQAGQDVPSVYRFGVKRRDGSVRRVEIRAVINQEERKNPETIAQLLDITELEKNEKIKEVIFNISQAVISTKNMKEFYKMIHNEINKIIDSKNFFVGIYDESSDTISLPYIRDEKDSFEKVPARGTISSLVIKENRSMILTPGDIKKLEDDGKIDLVGTPSKVWLGVPLRLDGKVIGVLVIQSYKDENEYEISDLELMEFISSQIASSISRKQKEEQIGILTQSIEQGPSIVMITDLDANIEYVNRKFEEITGYTYDEIIGKNPRILKSGDTPVQSYTELWSNLKSQKSWKGEFHNRKKDGTLYWENAFITCIRNSEGELTNYLAIKDDITEKKRLEHQLIQAQKMESIGTLAGGIAHDFNNLLTVINGYSDMLLMKHTSKDKIFRELSAIRAAGDRAEKLTRQIMAFSRKQIYKPQTMDINSIILDLEKMFRSLLGEDIDIRIKLTKKIPFIKADPGQIEQILINLLINSRDALNQKSKKAKGKKITIETSKKIMSDEFVKKHIGSKPGTYICLSVSDTGIGMSNEIKGSIFEPFFTTKGRDKGTGLGLATVYGIIKQNQGSIYVYSEPGIGTTFKIYWPVTEEKILEAGSSVFNRKALSGKESILIVEDDKQVLNFASSTLKSFGYNIYSKSNGITALRFVEKEKPELDLLVTDLVMPDMNGQELAEELIKIIPNIKILFASGYTDNHLVHQGQLKKEINFLSKPYSTKNLLKAIRETLDKL